MNIYEEAIQTFGREKQLDMVVEECAELIQAIQKYKRDHNKTENLIEEMVDVEIMLNQLKYIFHEEYKNLSFNLINKKLERLGEKVEKEKARQEVPFH